MTQESEFKFAMEPTTRRPGHPLLRFEAELKLATPQTLKNEETGKDRQVIKFDHIDLNVIDTEEPFPFPIISITLPYSAQDQTVWMAFAKSFRNLIPATEYAGMNMPFKILEGKRQTWAWLPAELRRPKVDEDGNPVMGNNGKQEWGVQNGDAWQLVSVQGYGAAAGGTDFSDVIVDNVDGKDEKEFMNWLFTDMSIKSMPGHSQAVAAQSERQLLPMLIERGKITQDANGIYHKVS